VDKQKTIAREVAISGIGLHTAHEVRLVFKPAGADQGIVFVRVDLPGRPEIRAAVESLLPAEKFPRRTSLGCGGAEVHTVEHLMAVLSALGIDNLCVEMDNDEVPGLDGSSCGFFELLSAAGIVEQDKERRYFVVREPVFVEGAGSAIIALPHRGLKISYTLDYNHPRLGVEFLEFELSAEFFKNEIAAARTFCLESEAQQLQENGLGQGANYENTLVLGAQGVIGNKLRYENEFIRHKVLDLIGDLYLVGMPLKGHIIALKSGHSLNLELAGRINQRKGGAIAAGAASVFKVDSGAELDVNCIKKILPHREPFLFVDRIVSLEEGRRASGIKNVSINDYFFKGHFPDRPVMPGVLILEAMAQVGGVMMLAPQENRGKLAFFMAANNVKFRKPVLPGDQLLLQVEAGKIKSKTAQVFAKALVDGKVVAEADFVCALVEG
jgi:UDP-3-O-[3-hydroxymyristoyl] N-acetylglucosamine deacetylase/3-hydroxyacyl-[acyl-carrier-protein] dehydratase